MRHFLLAPNELCELERQGVGADAEVLEVMHTETPSEERLRRQTCLFSMA
jgi:hypothetical protein